MDSHLAAAFSRLALRCYEQLGRDFHLFACVGQPFPSSGEGQRVALATKLRLGFAVLEQSICLTDPHATVAFVAGLMVLCPGSTVRATTRRSARKSHAHEDFH